MLARIDGYPRAPYRTPHGIAVEAEEQIRSVGGRAHDEDEVRDLGFERAQMVVGQGDPIVPLVSLGHRARLIKLGYGARREPLLLVTDGKVEHRSGKGVETPALFKLGTGFCDLSRGQERPALVE